MDNVLATPGALAVSDLPASVLQALKQHGYGWVSYQAQNGADTKAFDLGAARAAGLSAGVWGVTYAAADFAVDGKRLGAMADALDADHCIMDAEMAAKGTRPNGMRPIIDGVRQGGWAAAVHLSTLGAPANPAVNDYEMDVQSFLATGGGVLPQAYANASDDYLPERCAFYWRRMGVPGSRLNTTIGLHTSEADQQHPKRRFDGATWVPLLMPVAQHGLDPGCFNLFLAEYATPADLVGLDPLSLRPAAPTAGDTRSAMIARARLWEGSLSTPQPASRITLARRLLQVPDAAWRKDSSKVRKVLDDMGAPA